ncbi:MFS transporter [Nitratireductor sp. CAU 1489]|uniref:MFS transporter n=1 Tax=Nitratireductor arenosus TaxID=2682096 RepID=A0A844QA74_9HYPH|nr:MFS transporter [Nitratireductor arenosus]MVA96062.1 MFS transporter [Nitratireductor arenosus]
METPALDNAADETSATQRVFCPPGARKFVLVSAILASSMGFIDGSVVSLAMPAIRADLGGTLVDAQWISNSYMLFLSALVLIGGAAGDVFGVRNIFLGGIGLFMATSLFCALAPDTDTLILMRALQGVGAALMVPGSLAIIAKSYPANERGAAIGMWAAYSSLTMAAGPFLGGMLLSFGEDWMWRLIFAINVPIGLLTIGMLVVRVPRDRPSERRALDIVGAILATGGLGLMAWGLTALGLPPAERAAPPLTWIGAGGVLFVAFVVWEGRAPAPMVKLELFRSKAFSGANLYTLALFFGFGAVLFFLPMTLVSAWNAAEWQASLMFLPLSLLIAGLSGRAGRWADRIGPRLPLAIGGLLVALSFSGLAATMPLRQMWVVTLPVLTLMGLGMALLVSPLSAAVMLATPDEDTGLASGINNAVARAAGLMSVAALGAVAGLVFAALAPQGADVAFGALPPVRLAAAAELQRVEATNTAFQAVAAIAAALCLAAAIIAWLTQPHWAARERSVVEAEGRAANEGFGR